MTASNQSRFLYRK